MDHKQRVASSSTPTTYSVTGALLSTLPRQDAYGRDRTRGLLLVDGQAPGSASVLMTVSAARQAPNCMHDSTPAAAITCTLPMLERRRWPEPRQATELGLHPCTGPGQSGRYSRGGGPPTASALIILGAVLLMTRTTLSRMHEMMIARNPFE